MDQGLLVVVQFILDLVFQNGEVPALFRKALVRICELDDGFLF